MYPSFSPVSQPLVSRGEEGEESEGLSRGGMLPKGRSAPAQDGGGVVAAQGRGAQPQTHAQAVSLATISRATMKRPPTYQAGLL